MEQKDYLQREIDKIGVIIRAIRQKILGGKANLAISIDNQIEKEKELLLNELHFDFDKFLDLAEEESDGYILSIRGFSVENIDALAYCFLEIGFGENCVNSEKYLEKSLQLYNLSNLKSKTYSLERAKNIKTIKNALR